MSHPSTSSKPDISQQQRKTPTPSTPRGSPGRSTPSTTQGSPGQSTASKPYSGQQQRESSKSPSRSKGQPLFLSSTFGAPTARKSTSKPQGVFPSQPSTSSSKHSKKQSESSDEVSEDDSWEEQVTETILLFYKLSFLDENFSKYYSSIIPMRIFKKHTCA